MDFKNKIKCFTSFDLKIIAIITMAVDHIGAILLPEYRWLRIIGRLAFPIFCFLLAEGFHYTRDIRKYGLRLLAFALISEIPFNLAFSGKYLYFAHQNVFFTLTLGILMLWLYEYSIGKAAKLLAVVFCMLISETLHTDYSSTGLLMILFFHIFREKALWQKLGSVAGINLLSYFTMSHVQAYGAVSVIPIGMYNGEQGPKMKYLFYIFYPAHLLILFFIAKYIGV